MSGKRKDHTGKKYNHLTLMSYDSNDKFGNALWSVKCDCGNIVIKRASYVVSGSVKCCGCDKTIYVGAKYNHLTLMAYDSKDKFGHALWSVKCDCGNVVIKRASTVVRGNIKCCGCKTAELKGMTHGMSYSPEFGSWTSMKNRCLNPNSDDYSNYGGRGITVCQRWLNSFQDFFDDMGLRPSNKHSINRIDNDGNYEPGNCRWDLARPQCWNTRANVLIEYKGVSRCIAEWAEIFGIRYGALKSRLKARWTTERAFTTPVRKKRPNKPK